MENEHCSFTEPATSTESAGSPGLVTTCLSFVTASRVKRQISDVWPICLFVFYSNKGVFAVMPSETTEPKLVTCESGETKEYSNEHGS